MVEVAGLDPLQMVLVGTVLELSVFLFEIPTGVVADVVSRKLSVVVGHAMMGLGFLVLALWPTFTVILLSQVIWGVSFRARKDRSRAADFLQAVPLPPRRSESDRPALWRAP